jgi:indolepyruvate ferredoxin oxidoreductase
VERLADMPMPTIPTIENNYNVYVAGIGGLGVLTLGALLGTAAHLSGMEATVLDFTGLAQKNGAVFSQIRMAPAGRPTHAVRIGAGSIDLMIATDSLAAASPDGLRKLAQGKSALVLNTDETPTADAVMDRDATLPTPAVLDRLTAITGERAFRLRATGLAQGLFGDTVAANVMMLGYAWQQGLLPLTLESIESAIRANGAAVEMNLRALSWGRFTAIDLDATEEIAGIAAARPAEPETAEAVVMRRYEDLIAYQDQAYAQRYAQLVARARVAAAPLGSTGEDFVRAVATNAYKVMAYKDEYEVARLYSEPAFRQTLDGTFTSSRAMSVWLAPPLISRRDPITGRPAKRKFGPWIFTAFAILAKLKSVRGSWADPFGRTTERRAERLLVETYFADVGAVLHDLSLETLAVATKIAAVPSEIRGYGSVKDHAMAKASATRAGLQSELAECRDVMAWTAPAPA